MTDVAGKTAQGLIMTTIDWNDTSRSLNRIRKEMNWRIRWRIRTEGSSICSLTFYFHSRISVKWEQNLPRRGIERLRGLGRERRSMRKISDVAEFNSDIKPLLFLFLTHINVRLEIFHLHPGPICTILHGTFCPKRLTCMEFYNQWTSLMSSFFLGLDVERH